MRDTRPGLTQNGCVRCRRGVTLVVIDASAGVELAADTVRGRALRGLLSIRWPSSASPECPREEDSLRMDLFDDRGHHRLTIDPAADNGAAIACYRKVGFRDVGVMRAYERRPDGSWADGLLLDMLATDREPSDKGP